MFRQKFHKTYFSEPTKFAYLGFDQFFYLGKMLIANENQLKLGSFSWLGLSTAFNIQPVWKNNEMVGYENYYVNLLKFTDERIIKEN